MHTCKPINLVLNFRHSVNGLFLRGCIVLSSCYFMLPAAWQPQEGYVAIRLQDCFIRNCARSNFSLWNILLTANDFLRIAKVIVDFFWIMYKILVGIVAQ